MSDLLWVKMPTQWVSAGVLFEDFSSKQVSTEIAALKVYICLCLCSKIVTKNYYCPFLKMESYNDRFEAQMTYDQIMDSASLSRTLVSRGLKKLIDSRVIEREGTTRKKIYLLKGTTNRGWCKLPRKHLIKKNDVVSAFTAFTQRYEFERDALKLFIYLLSIRSNSKRYVDVCRGSIYEKTGIKIDAIDGALGFLRSVGLLEKVESKGYLKRHKYNTSLEFQKLHRYWVIGNSALNLKRILVESEDLPN